MKPAPLVLYHGSCYDGYTAAWVFDHFYKKRQTQMDPAPEFVGMNYGDKVPDCKGRDVYILDFSFAREVMIKEIILPSNKTTIWDHHKTAEADLKDLQGEIRNTYGINRQADKVVFDMSRSGAGITFDELSAEAGKRAGVHIPRTGGRSLWLVDYIEDRDIWAWKLPLSREVSAYLSTQPMTFENWDRINAMQVKEVADLGKGVLEYIDQFGDKAIQTARRERVGGYKVWTMNVPYMNCSDHVNKLLTEKGGEFAVGYFRQLDGKWQFSLRSVGDFDVSEVAKAYGGGGHKNAAGFKVDVLPWEQTSQIYKITSPEIMEEIKKLPPVEIEPIKAIPTVATPDGDDSVVKLGEQSE